MNNCLLIGFRGIGGLVFSRGLDDLADDASELGWTTQVYPWTSAAKAARDWADWKGPIFVVWHSAGARAGETFAQEHPAQSIAGAVAVDSWLPNQTINAEYQRVISVKAATMGRFHVYGSNVVEKVLIQATHTTVDDSDELRAIVMRELKRIAGDVAPEEPDMQFPTELQAMIDDARQAMNPATETARQTAFNKAFFDTVRPLFGSIQPSAVDGLKLGVYLFDKYIRPKGYGDELFVFDAANMFNETGRSFVPLRETEKPGHPKTEQQVIDTLNAWWASGKAAQAGVKTRYWLRNTTTGRAYFGRGLFQETWLGNYEKAGELWSKWFGISLDFVNHPELMLEPVVSWITAFIGTAEGKYTGKTLDDFRKDDDSIDWPATRAMVNGDRFLVRYDLDGDGKRENMGEEIAGCAAYFMKALEKGREAAEGVSDNVPVPVDPKPPETLPEPIPWDLDAFLSERYPDQEEDARRRAAMLADAIWYRSQTSPAFEPGFSLPSTGEFNMGNYSKLYGSLIGGILGILVSKNVIPAEFNTPEIQSALTVIGAAILTFLFPANKTA